MDDFDFGQSFPFIGSAWIHVHGAADVRAPTDVNFFGILDQVWGPSHWVFDVTAFETDVPLTPTDTVLDGEGTVDLLIGVAACCDHSALVTQATLWFCTGDPDISIDFAAKDQLVWSSPPEATAFDVIRGDLDALRVGKGDFGFSTEECLADDQPTAGLIHTVDPLPGEGFWYLVRRVVDQQNGGYDTCSPAQFGGRDAGIAASGFDCR